MHKNDGPGATPEGEFTEADPLSPGTPPSVVPADWLNTAQEEPKAVIEGAGLTLDKGDDAQLLRAVHAIRPATFGYRNLLINGGFDVWQRGGFFLLLEVTSPPPAFTADRWEVDIGDHDRNLQIQPVDAPGEGIVATDEDSGDTLPEVFAPTRLKIASTAGGGTPGSNPVLLRQRVEDVRLLAGRDVTLSWLHYTDGVGGFDIEANFVQFFGSSATTATVVGTPVAVGQNQNGAWKRFQATFSIPSVVGADLNEPDSSTEFQIRIPADAGLLNEHIARVMLTIGDEAGDFEERPRAVELLLCRRYFETSYRERGLGGVNDAVWGYFSDLIAGDYVEALDTPFSVRKRATPTVTWRTPTAGTSGSIEFPRGTTHSISSVFATSAESTGYPRISSPVGEGYAGAHFEADAELPAAT